MTVLLDDVIYTDYGSLDLLDDSDPFDGDADRFFAGQENGWVGAAVAGSIHVVLARRSGGSAIRIELLETEPPTGEWEDIVEVSYVATGGSVRWESWASESSGELDVPAGNYRVRVCAQGRDAGQADEFADEVLDRYLMQFWPSPPRIDAVLRESSQDAAYWNSAWGGRRSA